MKVLVINWRDMKNPEAGGAEIHIDEILKRKPGDWEVDFVSAAFPGCLPREMINGYTVTRISHNTLFNFGFRWYWNRVLSRKGYDLVIDDVSKIPLATPSYIRTTPLIGLLHHVHGKSLYSQLPWPLAFYVVAMEKHLLYRYQDIPFLVVSESTRDELARDYRFRDLHLCHNGIDFESYASAYCDIRNKPDTLFYFGRLKKYKRVDHVIRAFAEIRDTRPAAKLIIAGKGDDESRLKEIAGNLGLGTSIEFLGYVDEQTKRELLSLSKLYLNASEKEGWGISVIESNAAGLPSVGYRVEGLRDSILDGKTGFLAENGNIQDMAGKIRIILESTELQEKMSRNAMEWARRFSWDNTAALFYDFAANVVRNFRCPA